MLVAFWNDRPPGSDYRFDLGKVVSNSSSPKTESIHVQILSRTNVDQSGRCRYGFPAKGPVQSVEVPLRGKDELSRGKGVIAFWPWSHLTKEG